MIDNTNTYTKNNLVLHVNTDFEDTHKKQITESTHTQLPPSVDAYQDIDYEEVGELQRNVFHEDKIYVCDMLDKSSYNHLEYIEISHSIGDRLQVNAEVNFRISEWNSQINLLSFIDSMRKHIREKHTIHSEQENLYDEDLIHIKFKILATKFTSLPFVIQRFSKKLLVIHQDILSQSIQIKVS